MIIELKIPNNFPSRFDNCNSSSDKGRLLCHVTLANENQTENCSSVIVPNSDDIHQVEQQMRGCKITQPLKLIDPNDHQKKLFFVFPDLAIKSSGRFRLVIRLLNFGRLLQNLTLGLP